MEKIITHVSNINLKKVCLRTHSLFFLQEAVLWDAPEMLWS